MTKFNTIIGIVTLVTIAIIFNACSYPEGQKAKSSKTEIDTLQLLKKLDSIQFYAFKSDTINPLKFLPDFRGPQVVNRYPEYVTDAYVLALVGQQGVRKDLIGNNYTANLLREFDSVAAASQNKLMIGWSIYARGRYHCDVNEPYAALPELLKAIDVFKAYQDSNGLTVANKRLGFIYLNDFKDYDRAIYYFRNMLALSNKMDELAKSYMSIIKCHAAKGNSDSVIYFYNSMCSLDRINDFVEFYFARVYYDLCEYEARKINPYPVLNSLKILGEKLETSNSPYLINEEIKLQCIVSKALIGLSEFKLADSLINSSIELCRQYDDKNELRPQLLFNRYLYYQAKKEITPAFNALLVYNEANSNYLKQADIEKTRQLQMLVESETKKINADKQRDIKEALAKQQIKQQQFIRNVFIGGFFLMLLFAIVFFNQKNKTSKEKVRAESALHELKATQQQLVQQEKLASLGALTAGIAHEIKNPLNFVNNFSELSNELIKEFRESNSEEERKEILSDLELNLSKINEHGKRADSIVKNMLAHSRNGTGEKQLTNINELCEEYFNIAYHGKRANDQAFNCEMIKQFDSNLPQVNCVTQDISRVILILINNAFDAVRERESEGESGAYTPTVTVITTSSNHQISISIKDNGNGIPKHIKEKIFEPFFTTKAAGQGTGLGLSLSNDIIKAHGGEFKVESKEGEGCEFIILLPIS